jgi:hypothetical protein
MHTALTSHEIYGVTRGTDHSQLVNVLERHRKLSVEVVDKSVDVKCGISQIAVLGFLKIGVQFGHRIRI